MSSNARHLSLATTILGVIAALLAVATVGVFVQGWTLRQMADEETRKVFDRPYPELEAYEQEQDLLLSGGYAWLDREAGTVRLPIERAMALVVEEYGAGSPPPPSAEQAATEPADGEPRETAR